MALFTGSHLLTMQNLTANVTSQTSLLGRLRNGLNIAYYLMQSEGCPS